MAAGAITLVAGLGLLSGYFALGRTLLVLQLLILTSGLFVFYHTRREKVRLSLMVWPVMAAHVMVLPLTLLMVLAVRNEGFALEYWFLLNLAFVICMGITWLLLLASLALPAAIRFLLILASMVYLVLLVLHMSGYFANGKIIFFMGLVLFAGSVALVLFGIRKPQSEQEDAAPPVAG